MLHYGPRKILIILLFSMYASGSIAAEHDKEGAHEEGGHKKNTLGIFVGTTVEDNENHETFGFEYSYRLNKAWSFGGVVERADRDKSSTLIIAFAHWWPYKGLYLGGGVGRKDPGNERENTFRSTIGYEFELGGHWVATLEANLDAIENEENEEVYGFGFGRQF